MTLSTDMLALGRQLCGQLEPPRITGLHLPALDKDATVRDEFGVLFLADGTAAPFYTSLPGTLAELAAQFPAAKQLALPLSDCLEALATSSPGERALAIGAWNALGQHLMRRAGFVLPPPDKHRDTPLHAGTRIGMVGYFRPIVDRLIEQQVEVLVVEQQPERVPRHRAIRLSRDPAALADCDQVYCTASTLINDTLEAILGCCRSAHEIKLVGPSGSGLPDLLFELGIHTVGGVGFDDTAALRSALERRESWGSIGRKYELTSGNYPGVEALLAAAKSGA